MDHIGQYKKSFTLCVPLAILTLIIAFQLKSVFGIKTEVLIPIGMILIGLIAVVFKRGSFIFFGSGVYIASVIIPIDAVPWGFSYFLLSVSMAGGLRDGYEELQESRQLEILEGLKDEKIENLEKRIEDLEGEKKKTDSLLKGFERALSNSGGSSKKKQSK